MTAIRDRRSDPDTADDATAVPWDERSVVRARRGVPWWGAVLISLALAAAGAFAEQLLTGGLGVPFYACFVVGSLVAVLVARRRGVFGPMVQPPLIMAVVVPTSVLMASGLPEGSDMLSKALAVGTPLINSFPVMAGVTVVTVALGTWRMVRERAPGTRDREAPDADSASGRPRTGGGRDRPRDDERPRRGDA
ncbi:DUF6542 domain-containing protein, partial [Saccharomonospora saliphila]|uniref:DUF6542 domain-containing protein n=1 Tax=Saccharomonospora saliphila TaxID=369829 RepID=UPI000362E364